MLSELSKFGQLAWTKKSGHANSFKQKENEN